ncbi:TNF receptor-associated factor 5-like [Andrena cerasifolii]|uniref:TNF receptor-associated factor 5-like n=1 Tax=Andrena cerasifolii TaxID=2819439 RepID=UPI0040377929
MSNRVNSVIRRSVPCYFCNEFLEERHLPDHMKHCGSVLEECTFKCGVYVPRKNMEEHRRACERNSSKRNSQIKEVQDSLWRDKVFSTLTLLRSAINNEEMERRSLQDRLAQCLRLLYSQQDSIDALRSQVTETAEDRRRYDALLSQRLDDMEFTCDSMKQRTSLYFQEISEQLNHLTVELTEEQNKHDEVLGNWCIELKDLKAFLAQESVHVTGMWQEQQQLIHDLKLELEMRCKSSKESMTQQKELTERVNAIEEEIKKHSAIVADQGSNIKGLKFQTKENLKYLEELVQESSRSNMSEFVECQCERECFDRFPTNGRLLWRIDRYKEKMTDAKENGCSIYSPRFFNKEYGYTLRMEVYLNGIGQWKDRHVIGCLRVEHGKWDPLLDWPCILKATVTLRNQENPANDVKKLVKAVGHDKTNPENVDKESGIYMFIPHTTLTRYSGYVMNDALFLDIQVRDIKTSASTPLLAS